MRWAPVTLTLTSCAHLVDDDEGEVAVELGGHLVPDLVRVRGRGRVVRGRVSSFEATARARSGGREIAGG